jgi:hypothetical protein
MGQPGLSCVAQLVPLRIILASLLLSPVYIDRM